MTKVTSMLMKHLGVISNKGSDIGKFGRKRAKNMTDNDNILRAEECHINVVECCV